MAKTGREERKRTPEGRTRRPQLTRFYRNPLADVVPGAFEFRLTALRGGQTASLDIGTTVESFAWEDSEESLTGSLTFQRPDPGDAASFPIGNGHRVRCEVRWAGTWYELWTMRVQPVSGLNLGFGGGSLDLIDDLDLINRNRRHWVYKKSRRRPRGWWGHDILRHAAAREGVKLGRVAECKFRAKKIDMRGSLLDLIKEVYAHEREKSGRRFVIRMRDGLVELLPLQRNKILYELRETIEEATVSQEQGGGDGPVYTVIHGRGKIGKGKGAKKVRHTEYRRDVVNRLGFVMREKDYGKVDSLGDLREKCQRDLAKGIRVKHTASLSFPGIPFVRRGDGMRWLTDEEHWHGATSETRDRGFVYVRSASHQVGAEGYTTSVEVVQEDPYVKDQERREKEAREKARARRRQRRRGDP